ncbi:MAG: rhomboid family intramembrane serine protease [Flavobacteriaceae bacterium]|tara:strand:+ start:11901 stop:12551 length:651 start_codon:yes stop_codon:yes gene_type:complete
MMNIEPLTLFLMAANGFISYKGFQDPSFFDRYKFQVSELLKGDYKRLFTSAFLHVDINHLIFNLFTFYFFADVVIWKLGSIALLVVYLVSLMAGSYFGLFIHKKEPHYSAVGASGAVTGVLYAAIFLMPEMRLGIFFIPIPFPAYIVGLGYMLYTIYGMKKRTGNIGHSAHFGGAIGGLIIAIIMAPENIAGNPIATLCLLAPLVLMGVLLKNKHL